MTDTTERAELLAMADQIDSVIKYGDGSIVLSCDHAQKIASALRRLASQDQELVAHPYVKNIDGSPLYLSPPPAAGWNEAIETAIRVAKQNGSKTHPRVEALRHNAPPDSGAGKSAPPASAPLPSGERVGTVLTPHGGADAGVNWTPFEDGTAPWSEDEQFEEAAKACKSRCKTYGKSTCEGEFEGNCTECEDDAQVVLRRKYLSCQPAPVAANASAEARLREALDKRCYMVLGPHLSGWRLILGFNTLKEVQDAHETLYTPHASDCSSTPLEIAKANGLVTCLDETGLKITSEIYKACTDLKADACLLGQIGSWGDTLNDDDVLSGLKSYNEMGECFVPDRLHASDCDKQGCMGDASPGDAKDLQELLAKPSVLEPSDLTADVTWGELAVVLANARRVAQGYGPLTQDETKDVHLWPSDCVSKTQARALLDAYGMWRK